jgi:flagellar biosynthesis/type III secretory pathway chaperone
MLTSKDLGNQNSKWEASYDWLYNLTKKINKELRERNKLEKEENNILDARTTTVANLLDNINEQKQSLLQSLSYENERYTKRQRELAYANKTAQDKGIRQYVWMDKNNTVQINYDEIREVTDSAKG